jgi:hypothetical protein
LQKRFTIDLCKSLVSKPARIIAVVRVAGCVPGSAPHFINRKYYRLRGERES